MPHYCAVRGCPNSSLLTKHDPAIAYHPFPTSSSDGRLRKWIAFCRQGANWKPLKGQSICSKHFDESSFDERYQFKRQLKALALPSIGITRNKKSQKQDQHSDSVKILGHLKEQKQIVIAENAATEVTLVIDVDDDVDDNDNDNQSSSNQQSHSEAKCRVCRTVLQSAAKHLLHHAIAGKSYKEIIQESLNIYIDQDDVPNLLLCEDCCHFVEKLHIFVGQCQETFSQLSTFVPQSDYIQMETEEEWLDFDVQLKEVESGISRDAEPVSKRTRVVTEELTIQVTKVNSLGVAVSVPETPVMTEAKTDRSVDRSKMIHLKNDETKCSICGTLLANSHQLQVHMNLHTKEIEYPCHFCGVVFYLWQSQKNHEKMHLDKMHQVEHTCSECGALYASKRNVEIHYRLKHLELCRFSCKQCDYITYQRDRLVSHVRATHTTLKPYVCTICEHASGDDHYHFNHFQRHKKKGETSRYDISCAYCRRIFTDEDAFENHLVQQHPETAVEL